MKHITEFKSNSTHFLKRTVRRLSYELTVLAALAVAVALDLLPIIPMWLQLSAVTLITIYVAFELALYPCTKAIADSLSIQLHDEGLSFAHAGARGELRYSDLRIARVRKRGDEVTEIVLAARSGQTINLQGLENMSELYRLLSARVIS